MPRRHRPTGDHGYGTITTCGGLAPSRLENSAVFVDPDVASNEYVPLPVIALVTSTSTQVPALPLPTVATGLPLMTGLLFQFTPVSVQPLSTLYQLPQLTLRVDDEQADLHGAGAPDRPLSVNFTIGRYSALVGLCSFSTVAVA